MALFADFVGMPDLLVQQHTTGGEHPRDLAQIHRLVPTHHQVDAGVLERQRIALLGVVGQHRNSVRRKVLRRDGLIRWPALGSGQLRALLDREIRQQPEHSLTTAGAQINGSADILTVGSADLHPSCRLRPAALRPAPQAPERSQTVRLEVPRRILGVQPAVEHREVPPAHLRLRVRAVQTEQQVIGYHRPSIAACRTRCTPPRRPQTSRTSPLPRASPSRFGPPC